MVASLPLFPRRRLELAVAALAWLGPLAAGAAPLTAPSVSLDNYSSADEQVTSISQFSDVQPTDWAYQALSALVEKVGCVAGYPNGTFKAGQPLSRFEAAALLNACLDHVTEVTDELKKLIKEFETERAVLKGRVDGLEARVGVLAANPFSTTTRLRGKAAFVVGANSFSGSSINTGANTATLATGASLVLPNATTFNYDVQLILDTSFTGKDLLRTKLRAGNFGQSVFGGEPPELSLAVLETAFQETCQSLDGTVQINCANVLAVDRLFYQFPIGEHFTATLGAFVAQDEMLAFMPSVYPSDTILNMMTVNGAVGAYNLNAGAGAGLWWKNNGWSVSANVVAANGSLGAPGSGGIATQASGSSTTVQVGYNQEQYGVAALWSLVQGGVALQGGTPFVISQLAQTTATTNAWGISGYWQPVKSGWAPSISAGWGINTTTLTTPQPAGSLSGSQSWMVGLEWSDVFRKGNAFGMAVSQPMMATALTGQVVPNDGSFVWEWWYKLQVSDAITVTPALLYFSRPLGQETVAGQSFSQLGALIKTTFHF